MDPKFRSYYNMLTENKMQHDSMEQGGPHMGHVVTNREWANHEIMDPMSFQKTLHFVDNGRPNMTENLMTNTMGRLFMDSAGQPNDPCNKVVPTGSIGYKGKELITVHKPAYEVHDPMQKNDRRGTYLDDIRNAYQAATEKQFDIPNTFAYPMPPNIYDTHPMTVHAHTAPKPLEFTTMNAAVRPLEQPMPYQPPTSDQHLIQLTGNPNIVQVTPQPPPMQSIVTNSVTDNTQTSQTEKTKTKPKQRPRQPTTNKTYQCEFCKKFFTQSSHLKVHYRVHSGARPFKCDMCGKAFSQGSHLKSHIRTHTGDKPYKCDLCEKRFTESGALKSHRRTHTGDKPYHCTTCNKNFTVSSHLKKHMRTHSGEKPHECKICAKKFTTACSLERHTRIHTGDKPFQCESCYKTFNDVSILKRHERTHEKTAKPFVCKQEGCAKRFSDAKRLEIHLKKHEEERPFVCELCRKTFPDTITLRKHLQSFHQGDVIKAAQQIMSVQPKPVLTPEQLAKQKATTRSYQCEICMKLFTQSSHLKVHYRLHTGSRPFACEVCHKAFSQGSHLKAHMRTHTGQRPYACDKCSKSFTESGALKKHSRTHTGDKPYHCTMCNKRFTTSSHLKKHIRSHFGEKPHPCSICQKSFSTSCSLERHTRIHTGIKPFQCETCFRCFNDRSILKRHERTHTGEKPYHCDVCDKNLAEASSLRNHMKKHSCDKPFSCHRCGKGFLKRMYLKKHMRMHPDDKPFKCDVCPKAFRKRKYLRKHKQIHHGETPQGVADSNTQQTIQNPDLDSADILKDDPLSRTIDAVGSGAILGEDLVPASLHTPHMDGSLDPTLDPSVMDDDVMDPVGALVESERDTKLSVESGFEDSSEIMNELHQYTSIKQEIVNNEYTIHASAFKPEALPNIEIRATLQTEDHDM